MAIIQFRVDDELRAEATAIYEKLGIDLSTAMRMFLKRSVSANSIPFSMVLPEEKSTENKALAFMKELNASAEKNGTADMSLNEINEEISTYRGEKRV